MTTNFAGVRGARRTRFVQAVGACLLCIAMSAGAQLSGVGDASAAPLLLAVTVSPTAANVPKGDTTQLTATGHYSNLTTANITTSVTWSSSSAGIATVSNASGSAGLVTGDGTGAATITATAPGALLSGTAAVTVLPPVLQALNLTVPSASLPKGETEQLSATGLLSDGTTEDLTNAVTWASSSGGVASVSSSGLATALTTGVTSVTATYLSLISNTKSLDVIPAVLQSLSLSVPSSSLPKGESQQLTATGLLSDGTTEDLTGSVTWSTSTPSTMSVSPSGLATAVGTGVATITATDPTSLISSTTSFNVVSAVLQSLSLTVPSASLPKGETEQLTATGFLSDGSTEDLTNEVSWAGSNEGVASVSSSGLVTALTTGATSITATDPTSLISGTGSLSVVPAVLQSLRLSTATVSLPKGETQQLSATGLFSDGTTADLTDALSWVSSNSSVATVSPTGLISAVTTGTSTITATDPLSSISGSTSLTVLPAVLQALHLSSTINLPAGETQQLTATGIFSDGTTSDVTSLVSWATSSSSLATVSSSGLVTAVSAGTATITATDPLTLISSTTSVDVLPAVLLAVTVSPPIANVPAGETQQLTARGVYSDGSTADLTGVVTWSTSSSSTASVSSSGLVTGVGTGVATISATDPSSVVSGVSVITVLPAVLLQVKVTPSPAAVPVYDSVQLIATGYYSDGSTRDVTGQVTWASADSSIATVSPTGLLTGVATGQTTINASSSVIASASTSITVTGPSITITPTSGPRGARVKIRGQGFTPGSVEKIAYKTGVASAPKELLCKTIISTNGTFSCKARIPSGTLAGAKGVHTISAKSAHTKDVLATATYTLT